MWLTRHKSLAMAIGIGIATVVLILVAIFPLYQSSTKISGKINSKTKELESLTAKVSILSKLDPNVLKDRVTVLDNALPPRKDVLLYLTSIDGLSRELGLTFGGLSLSPGDITEASGSAKTVKLTGLQTLQTDIKMQGNQDSIYSFLRSIESVLPLMQIKDVKVSVLGNDQYSLALTLSMLWSEPSVIDVKGPVTLFGVEEDKYFTQLSEYRRFDTVLSSPIDQGKNQDLFAPFSVETPTPLPQPRPVTPQQ